MGNKILCVYRFETMANEKSEWTNIIYLALIRSHWPNALAETAIRFNHRPHSSTPKTHLRINVRLPILHTLHITAAPPVLFQSDFISRLSAVFDSLLLLILFVTHKSNSQI